MGQDGSGRASTMATGTMGALAQVAAIVRNDAAKLEQKAVALDAKKHAVLSTVNRLLRFMSRVDALTSRVEALEAKRKADEAVQRKLDEEEIELPPDIAEYQTRTPPSEVGGDTSRQRSDETHQPGGELHTVAAKEEEHHPSYLSRRSKPRATRAGFRSAIATCRPAMCAAVRRIRPVICPKNSNKVCRSHHLSPEALWFRSLSVSASTSNDHEHT